MSSNLVTFAKELSRTKPEDLPEKFLQLDRMFYIFFFFKNKILIYQIDILQRSTSITSVKHDIISLDILPVLLLTLRQDFTIISNGWRLASINLSKLAW